jgi:hypothetical protein
MKFLHALEHLDDLRPCKRKKLRGPSQQIDHRPDLILKTPSVRGQAFIIEIETADRLQDMAKKCREWIWQIKKNYRDEPEKDAKKKPPSCFPPAEGLCTIG